MHAGDKIERNQKSLRHTMRAGLETELERLENGLQELEESIARTGSRYAEKHGRLRHYCDKVKATIER